MRVVAAVTMTGMLMGRALAAESLPVVITDPARPGVELLGFSGNPQVLRISLWFWQHGSVVRPCTVLHLRAAGTIPTVHVMTTGLGRTSLAVASDPKHACDSYLSRDWDWREQIELTHDGSGDMQDWALAVIPDPTALEADGMAMDGQIIALAPRAGVVAAPLKVERLPLSAIMNAVLWTLGVALPAGLSYVLARAADRWNEQRKVALDRQAARTAQIEAFAAWRQEAGSRVAIADVIAEIETLRSTQGYDRPCRHLQNFMYRRDMLAKMPSDARERLNEICRQEQKQELLDMLRELLPEVHSYIPATW